MARIAQDVLARNGADTHNAAVQACAAKLILLLRKDFSAVAPLSADETKQIIANMSQYLRYIDGDSQRLDENAVLKGKKIIAENSAILQFIKYVLSQKKSPFDAEETRKKVFKEILRLCALDRDHWTQNAVTQTTNNAETVVDAGLGETLGLVYLALSIGPNNGVGYQKLKSNITKDTEKDIEEDKEHRLLSLFKTLERLASETKCTGGRQHDLLYLLNGVYPEIKADGSYKAIQLIEDLNAFLLESMNNFLIEKLLEIETEENNQSKLFNLVKTWILNQTDVKISANSAADLQSWKTDMQTKLQPYLQLAARSVGVASKDYQQALKTIDTWIYAIHDLNIPAINSVVPLMVDTLSLKADGNKKGYAKKRNIALAKVREFIINSSSFDELKNILTRYKETEHFYQTLKKYNWLTMPVGEQEGEFKAAIDNLRKAIDARFFAIVSSDSNGNSEDSSNENRETLSTPGHSAFEFAKKEFLEQEKIHKKESNFEFVVSFFAILTANSNSFQSQLARLEAENEKKSLLLTEDSIAQLLQANTTADGVVDITPYEVNRILLHAMLTIGKNPTVVWGPNFKQALAHVVAWLLKSDSGAAIVDNDFRASYYKQFLYNLQVIVLIKDNPDCETVLKRTDSYGIYNNDILNTLFALLVRLSRSDEQRTAILNAIKNKLNIIINNFEQLNTLLQVLIPPERGKILNFIDQKKLGTLIESSDHLDRLLKTPKLTPDQRSIILAAVVGNLVSQNQNRLKLNLSDIICNHLVTTAECTVIFNTAKGNLGTLIQNVDQFSRLLQAPTLTPDQRTAILYAIQSNLGTLIQDEKQLYDVLEIPELTKEHRKIILAAVLGDLSKYQNKFELLINLLYRLREKREERKNQNKFELLINLFYSLIGKREEREEYTAIWDAVKNNLGTLIQNGYQFSRLLKVPTLTPDQHTAIWDAVKNNLGTIIQDGMQLCHLLETLTPDQRTAILKAVKNNLGTIIQCGMQLRSLLTITKLTPDQRTEILYAIQSNLGTLIQEEEKLYNVLKIPELTKEHRKIILVAVMGDLSKYQNKFKLLIEPLYMLRQKPEEYTVIINAITDNLGTIIQNVDQFLRLLYVQTLTLDQHAVIWDAVKNNLGTLIQDGHQLYNLLKFSKLTPEQHAVIWKAVKNNLGRLIQDGDQFLRLLYVQTLTLDQLDEILNAVKDNLGRLIQDGDQFLRLLQHSKLTSDQRDEIWNAVKNNLGRLIQDGHQLYNLLKFSKLTPEQHAVIWKAVKNNLGTLIQDGHQLCNLLEYYKSTPEQHAVIWKAVKDNLGTLIQEDYQFVLLFKSTTLTSEQRTAIWDAVKNNLGTLIQDGHQLLKLLKITELTPNQRTAIWNAVKDKLDIILDNLDAQDHSKASSLRNLLASQISIQTERNNMSDVARNTTRLMPIGQIAGHASQTRPSPLHVDPQPPESPNLNSKLN